MQAPWLSVSSLAVSKDKRLMGAISKAVARHRSVGDATRRGRGDDTAKCGEKRKQRESGSAPPPSWTKLDGQSSAGSRPERKTVTMKIATRPQRASEAKIRHLMTGPLAWPMTEVMAVMFKASIEAEAGRR